ncbi:MAG: leucine-rich repeat domain-containing protein, partial [Candidatus Hodarchaeota archaeon]
MRRDISFSHTEAKALSDLEQMLGDFIPEISSINSERSDFGIVVEIYQITGLALDRRGLTHLPKSLDGLTNLKKLSLADNQIQALPETFGNLTNLEESDLSCNYLQSLPENFSNLWNLRKVDLYDNHLQSFPKSCSKLINLEHIDLG